MCDEAVTCAKRRSTAADTTIFDFIREVLLIRQGEGRPSSIAAVLLISP